MSQVSESISKDKQGKQVTQLTAINTAKTITIFFLIGCAILLGISGMRQVLYLSIHVSYCVWWLIEQWLFPKRREVMFSESASTGTFISIILFVGFLYALPGYLAFVNPEPIANSTVLIALPLFFFGSLINTAADVQKLTAKEFGAGLVQNNIWRFSRNINYFGDLLRYLSFAVIAGSPWAYIVPGLVALLYLQRIFQKEQSMKDKYSEYETYQKTTARLVPFVW
ncbi:MAG: methyltransferase family protein [Microcoleaceae cyanobacterium]